MVLSRVNIVKLIIFALTFVLLLYNTFNTVFKSNLFEAILPENYIKNSSIMNIMNKTSNSINVIFKGDSEEEVLEYKKKFRKNADSKVFEVLSFDVGALNEFYSKSPQNFLSDNTKKDLKNHNYDSVFENAIYNLYSPVGIQIMPFEKDPYFLFNGFIEENFKGYSETKEIDGKFYTNQNIRIKDDYNFASKNIGKSIEKLIKTTNNAIFSGSLIHSFYTTKYTSFFINLICVLSGLFILVLNYYYFKNFKPLLLITLSIIFGFLAGFSAVKICFSDFHIITLLFATTLIGIGIDYSLHYFFNKGIDKNFIKNLSFSYLTTAIAFSVMFLSKIELLEQICVFIVFGLLGIYLFVVFVYPIFNIDIEIRYLEFNINDKFKKAILLVLLFVFIFSIFRAKFDDSLLNLYSPNKKLIQSETIYNKLTNKNNLDINFLVNKAENIEQLLQKEERLNDILKSKNIDFISISKFIPSRKTQAENIELVKDLYNKNFDSFSDILSKEQIKNMKNESKNLTPVEFNFENSYFNYFMTDKNKSYTIAYSNDISGLEKYCDEVINIKKNISNILKNYRHKILKLLPVVYVLIFVLLYCVFGISKAVRMYLPVLFSGVLALSFAALFGFKINLFSIISVFLVMGFTLDYSIFRFNADKNTDCAIFASVLTTSFSFLLLSFVPFKLVSSISAILFFGIIISYFIGKILQQKSAKTN